MYARYTGVLAAAHYGDITALERILSAATARAALAERDVQGRSAVHDQRGIHRFALRGVVVRVMIWRLLGQVVGTN